MRRNFHVSEAGTKPWLVAAAAAICLGVGAAVWLGGAGNGERGGVPTWGIAPATSGMRSVPIDDTEPVPSTEPETSDAPTREVDVDLELVAGETEADVIKDDLSALGPTEQGQRLRLEGEGEPPAADAGAARVTAATPAGALDVDAATTRTAVEPPRPEVCGRVECAVGLVCCNPSCGTCVRPGEACSKLTCSMPTFPSSAFCGSNTCSVGEVCCNLSCGICAPPGAECSQRSCD